MIPEPFRYHRANSVAQAVGLLAALGPSVALLAGGQSLNPLMRRRIRSPRHVVDIGRIAELSYVRRQADQLAVGCATRLQDLLESPLVPLVPPLADVLSWVGDPQVRHLGTLGGSLALADPRADLPAVIVALHGRLVLHGHNTVREIPAEQFFTGAFTTALLPTELLTGVRLPIQPAARGAHRTLRAGAGWAVVSAIAVRAAQLTVALTGLGPTPWRARAVEAALRAGADENEAAELADRGTVPPHDHDAGREYRVQLARVLVRRVLAATAP